MCSIVMIGQLPEDAIDSVWVECYYQADALDAADTDGGSIAEGAITYRVYLDLADSAKVTALYGNEWYDFNVSTSTEFFNNEDRGEALGIDIPTARLDENTVALDSWLTIGAASDELMAIPKEYDTDGSDALFPNDLDLLANQPTDPLFEPFLADADGMIAADSLISISLSPGLDLSLLADENDGPTFSMGASAIFAPEGVGGKDVRNSVLIGQFTTDGVLSYSLNVQIKPSPSQVDVQFVPEINPESESALQEFAHEGLMVETAVCQSLFIGIPDYYTLNEGIQVLPNPSNGIFTIALEDMPSETGTYSVIDSNGRILVQEQFTSNAGKFIEEIDISSVANGMYLLRVETDGQFGVQRIIKK